MTKIVLYPDYFSETPKLLQKWNDEINRYPIIGEGTESICIDKSKRRVVLFTTDEIKVEVLRVQGLLKKIECVYDPNDSNKKIFRLVVIKLNEIFAEEDENFNEDQLPYLQYIDQSLFEADSLFYKGNLPIDIVLMRLATVPVYPKHVREAFKVAAAYLLLSDKKEYYSLDWHIGNWMYDDKDRLYCVDPLYLAKRYRGITRTTGEIDVKIENKS